MFMKIKRAEGEQEVSLRRRRRVTPRRTMRRTNQHAFFNLVKLYYKKCVLVQFNKEVTRLNNSEDCRLTLKSCFVSLLERSHLIVLVVPARNYPINLHYPEI